MAKKLNDPLESAKLASEDGETHEPGKKRSKARAKAVVEPPAEEKIADPAPPPKAADLPPAPKKYEVLRRITISWKSQMITLHPGKIVSSTSYDIDRLRNCGVALKEV